MRSFLAVAPLALLAACAAAPQVDLDAETAALHARSTALANAEAAKDVNAAITFWADDAIVQAAGAPAMVGLPALREGYTQLFATLKQFKSTTTALTLAASADLAWEHGVNDMVFTGPNGDVVDKGKYLAVWKKVNNEWYVAALSVTSDMPPQPAPQPAQ